MSAVFAATYEYMSSISIDRRQPSSVCAKFAAVDFFSLSSIAKTGMLATCECAPPFRRTSRVDDGDDDFICRAIDAVLKVLD